MNQDVVLKSEIKCPECGYRKVETMPTEFYLWRYECARCHMLLQPLQAECCIFCSYGSIPCPPIQLSNEKDGCRCYKK
ncbi:GDCCVxC domain-containing (seleno)protein [Nitrosomonas aestuarii]|uniref:Uncharacterized protein n=1 Tax=Nitrosomonas aestuarii TaxID=52441 RepID=A0A1I4GGV6_9PROT|nr:GDCCVxC domain-containing (seleno)protein [Nitrosomonas aestuarii]PTN12713.1 hypothetical protein C8R11_103282 [Nitrosomonas aestuarii]SFL28421.1 hypothetical protein SAMN05216302_105313 [Nitrosomonas aestuarii]